MRVELIEGKFNICTLIYIKFFFYSRRSSKISDGEPEYNIVIGHSNNKTSSLITMGQLIFQSRLTLVTGLNILDHLPHRQMPLIFYLPDRYKQYIRQVCIVYIMRLQVGYL